MEKNDVFSLGITSLKLGGIETTGCNEDESKLEKSL